MACSSNRYPLRFYILGCQRTGTTLLRLILECHSRVFCFDETKGYEIIRSRDFSPPAGKGVCRIGLKIPRWTERLLDPGFPDDVEHSGCQAFYLGEPLLFMLRDARAVVASMIRLQEGAKPWVERWGRPVLKDRIENDESFHERYSELIGRLEDFGWSQAAVGAFYWRYKTEAIFDYYQAGLPVLGIRYEDLVSSPETILRRVVAFLGLHWEPSLLAHEKLAHAEVADSGLTLGGTDPSRPIECSSMERWKDDLTQEQLWQVEVIAGNLDSKLASLEPVRPHVGPGAKLEHQLRSDCAYLALSSAQAEIMEDREAVAEQGLALQELNRKAHEIGEWAKGLAERVESQEREITRLRGLFGS